jgi:hypothetical protein
VERYSNGKCKPCQKKSAAKYLQSDKGRAKQQEYRQSDEVRAKQREYLQSDEFRAKQRKYRQSDKGRAKQRKYRQSDKGRATIRQYRQSDEVRAKHRELQRKRRQSATGSQEIYAAKVKRKKLNFEFSLQNQIKELTQCQQKLTQQNEMN